MQIVSKILNALETIPQLNIAKVFSNFHMLFNGLFVTEDEQLICFTDTLGNYVWIEQQQIAKVTIEKSLYGCGNIHKITNLFSLYFVGESFDSEKLASFLISVIAAQGDNIVVNSVSYDLQSIITNKLQKFAPETINDTLIRFCDYSIVKIDFSYYEIIAPYIGGCPIDICNEC